MKALQLTFARQDFMDRWSLRQAAQVLVVLVFSSLANPANGQTWYNKIFNTEPTCLGFDVDEVCLGEAEFLVLVQTKLNEAGCTVGRADGIIGPKSERWLKALDSIWEEDGYQDLLRDKRSDDLLARIQIMGEQVCKTAFQLSNECRGAYNRWKALPGASAFVANATGGCTTASGYASKANASAAALNNCKRSGFPCKVIDTKNPRTGAELCSAQDKAFRKAKTHKAVALGSGTCYMVTGARSVKRARSQAIDYCKRKGGKQCRIVRAQ